MRSISRLLLSRIGHQHQPYSPFVRHSAIRFYTSQNSSEERSGVWNVVKKCSSWIKNKLELRVTVPEGNACVTQQHGAYVNTLTSEAISIPKHPVVTCDNAPISVDGSMVVKIVDPTLSPYALEKPMDAVIMLTQTIVRAQIGKVTLDETFEKRDTLNERILMKINDKLKDWGVECIHYEIRDITLPTCVKEAMEKLAITKRQVAASRLEAEEERQKSIKIAEEKVRSMILATEAEIEARERNL